MDKKTNKTQPDSKNQNTKVKDATDLGRKASSSASNLSKTTSGQRDNLNIQKGVNNTAIDSDIDDQDQDDDVF